MKRDLLLGFLKTRACGERNEKSKKQIKRRNVCVFFNFAFSFPLSFQSYYKNAFAHNTHTLSLSLTPFAFSSLSLSLHLVVSKMYVRNESNILSYVARSLLYTLSGADMIKAKSLPVLSTVALTP